MRPRFEHHRCPDSFATKITPASPHMKILRDGETLSVSEISELDAANSESFSSQLRAALPANMRQQR